MKSTALLREKSLIDNLFVQLDSYNGDLYYEALLVYYLCIRVSGFLENSVRIIFSEYATSNCQGQVQEFVRNKLKRFPNPTWTEIVKLTGDFNKVWADNLKSVVTKEYRDSVESLSNNRNNIAHGQVSNITIRELKKYYTDIVFVIEKLLITGHFNK